MWEIEIEQERTMKNGRRKMLQIKSIQREKGLYFPSVELKQLYNGCMSFMKWTYEHNRKPLRQREEHVCEGSCKIIESKHGFLYYCLESGNIHQCTIETCTLKRSHEEGSTCPFSNRMYQLDTKMIKQSAAPSETDGMSFEKTFSTNQSEVMVSTLASDPSLLVAHIPSESQQEEDRKKEFMEFATEVFTPSSSSSSSSSSSASAKPRKEKKEKRNGFHKRQEVVRAYFDDNHSQKKTGTSNYVHEKRAMMKTFNLAHDGLSARKKNIQNFEQTARQASRVVWKQLILSLKSMKARGSGFHKSHLPLVSDLIKEKYESYCIGIWEMIVLSNEYIKRPNTFKVAFVCLAVIYELLGKGRDSFPVIKADPLFDFSRSKLVPDIKLLAKIGFDHSSFTNASKQVQDTCLWWWNKQKTLVSLYDKLPRLVKEHYPKEQHSLDRSLIKK
jgi:hypothetical protein